MPTILSEQPPPSQRPSGRDSILRRNLRLGTIEGLAATPLVYLALPGNFIIAALLTKVFGMEERVYGLIVSLPSWCNVAQIALVPALARHFPQKSLTVAFAWLHNLCWISLAVLLPFIPGAGQPGVGLAFFAFFLVSSLLASIAGVTWTSWVQEWVPERTRGRYFGARNRLLQLSQLTFLFATAWLLERLQASVAAYQILILGSALLRCISLVSQQRILSTSPIAPAASPPWLGQLSATRRNRPLLFLFAFGASWGFAANLAGPFYSVFMYQVVGLSVGDVTVLVALAGIGAAVSFPSWGQLLARYGNKPVALFTLIAWQTQNFLWLIISPDLKWLLFPMWVYGGVMSAGFFMASFNLLLKIITPEIKTTAISLNLALTSITAAVAPILSGQALAFATAAGVSPLAAYHTLFFISPALALLGVFFLFKVQEPRAGRLSDVVGAMRSYRQVGALLGLTFLVNYIFTKPRR
jgi:MFS family permease